MGIGIIVAAIVVFVVIVVIITTTTVTTITTTVGIVTLREALRGLIVCRGSASFRMERGFFFGVWFIFRVVVLVRVG